MGAKHAQNPVFGAATLPNDRESSVQNCTNLESNVEKPFLTETIEDESIEGDGATEDDEEDTSAEALGTHIVRQNPYFYFSHHPDSLDVKVILNEKWRDDLGLVGRSKALTILHYDERLDSPVRSIIALRAKNF